MSKSLLSTLQIKKLGHNIEEIRVRALKSIVSKFKLGFVEENDLLTIEQLLSKLLDWFILENNPQEQEVINLIYRICKHELIGTIISDIGVSTVLEKLKLIKSKVTCDTGKLKEIEDIVKRVDATSNEALQSIDSVGNISGNGSCSVTAEIRPFTNKHVYEDDIAIANARPLYVTEKKIEIAEAREQADIMDSARSGVQLDLRSCSERSSSISSQTVMYDPTPKYDCTSRKKPLLITIEKVLFTQHPLTSHDRNILTSVNNELQSKNEDKILKSLRFFKDVIIKDYPPELFLQRPVILKSLYELLKIGNIVGFVMVVDALTEFVRALKARVRCCLDPGFHPANISKLKETKIRQYLKESEGLFNMELDEIYDLDEQTQLGEITLSQCVILTLIHLLPQLTANQTQETINHMCKSLEETVFLLTYIVDETLWTSCEMVDVRENIFYIFTLFENCIKYHRNFQDKQMVVVYLLSLLMHIFSKLIPPSFTDIYSIIPRGLQLELSNCISDPFLVLMYPKVHSLLLNYVKLLPSQREAVIVKNYEDTVNVCKSIESFAKFIRSDNMTSKSELIIKADESFLSFDYHKSLNFVFKFFEIIFVQYSKESFKREELEGINIVLLKLLSHVNMELRVVVYGALHQQVMNLVGVQGAKRSVGEYPGNHLELVFTSHVLTEIISHGADSNNSKIREYSEEILVHMLRSKYLTSIEHWDRFMLSITPCLGLLQCLTDKTSQLGHCITKMIDPDVAPNISVPFYHIFRGNLRLLFSKDQLVREEAISRICWILTKEDMAHEKLPKVNLLQGVNLSNICLIPSPVDIDYNRHAFYNSNCLAEVIDMLTASGVEPMVRRSALTQISVMLDDFKLHTVFINKNGLEKVLSILENCLIETQYENYADSVVAIITILKNLSYNVPTVRQQLSINDSVLYCVTRGLLMFNGNDKLRQDCSILLVLLLFNDYILCVPSDVRDECRISLPYIVVSRIYLPFKCRIHGRESKHTTPSMREILMKDPNTSSLLRIYFALQFCGLSTVLSGKLTALTSSKVSPDIQLSSSDVKKFKLNYLPFLIQTCFWSVQNATSHERVIFPVAKITQCLMILSLLEKLNNCPVLETRSVIDSVPVTLPLLPWESTFHRYLSSPPSSYEDEKLFLSVLRLVRMVTQEKTIAQWLTSLYSSHNAPLIQLLDLSEVEELNLERHEIGHEVFSLLQDLTGSVVSCPEDWKHAANVVVKYLKCKQQDMFYNLAQLDWNLLALLQLTDIIPWDQNLYREVIDCLVHLSNEFQQKTLSFMGLQIKRNTMFILNHLLSDMRTIKGWPRLWTQFPRLRYSRDPFVLSLSLQLLSGALGSTEGAELVDGSGINFSNIWQQGFSTLFDYNETSVVRQKTADVLVALTWHGTRGTSAGFLEHLVEIDFYSEITTILQNVFLGQQRPFHVELQNLNKDIVAASTYTTPSFASSVLTVLHNTFLFNPQKVFTEIQQHDLMYSIMRLLTLPREEEIFHDTDNSVDCMDMLTNCCTVLVQCLRTTSAAAAIMIKSQHTMRYVYNLLNSDLYETSARVNCSRNNLWTQVLDIFSLLINPIVNISSSNSHSEDIDEQKESFISTLQLIADQCNVHYLLGALLILLKDERFELKLPCFHIIQNLSIPDNQQSRWIKKHLDSEELVPPTAHRTYGEAVCDLVLHHFILYTVTRHADRTSALKALASLLVISNCAKEYVLKEGLVESTIRDLREIYAKLSLEHVDCLRKPADHKRLTPILFEVEVSFQLLTNLMSFSDNVKSAVAKEGVCEIVYKLWPWITVTPSLMNVVLKMLCTFTTGNNQGSTSLAIATYTFTGLGGPRRTSNTPTLLHTLISQAQRDTDLVSQTHDTSLLRLNIRVLVHSCSASEARAILCKSQFLLSVLTKFKVETRASRSAVIHMWCWFYKMFTRYQEAQLAIAKQPELVDTLLTMSKSSSAIVRLDALAVLRNLCFHQLNRVRFLNCTRFLNVLNEVLKSEIADDVFNVAVMILALATNSQKSKIIFRSSGIENTLIQVRGRFLVLNNQKVLDVLESTLQVLQNR